MKNENIKKHTDMIINLLKYGFLIVTIFLSFPNNSFAEGGSYKISITRNDITKTRFVYNYWSHEFPTPVINVNARKPGYTKIYAYKSLRKLNQKVICTIKNGLYHPWSKTANSVINYYTIIALHEYIALISTMLDSRPVKKGQIITNVHYLSEGYCSGNLKSNQKIINIDFTCSDIDKNKFKQITTKDNFVEQWLYMKCREGYNAFIKDAALLKQPGIKGGNRFFRDFF